MTGASTDLTQASRREAIAFIFKKALISALVALVLFALMIGVRTEAGPTGQLIYWTRFGDLATMVGIVFVGSIVVGFIYNFGQALVPELAYFILFLPMVLVLVLRPQGLFGGQVL